MQNLEEVAEMKLKIDDMEQYSRRTFLNSQENTDNAIMNKVRKGGDGYLGKHFITLLRKYFIMLYLLCYIKETVFVLN